MIDPILIPCPVCGESEAEIYRRDGRPRAVFCPCGAELQGGWSCDQEAVDNWNTRVVFGQSVVFQREKPGVISLNAVWVVFANCRLFCAEEYDEVMHEIYNRWEDDRILVG